MAEIVSSLQKMDDPYAIGRAVQKAIQDSTDATSGDVGRFLRSLREQGYYVAESRRDSDSDGCGQ